MVKLIQNGWAKWSFIKTQKIMHLFTILCFNYLTLFKKKKISMSHVALSLSLSLLCSKSLKSSQVHPTVFCHLSLSLSLFLRGIQKHFYSYNFPFQPAINLPLPFFTFQHQKQNHFQYSLKKPNLSSS